MEKKYPEVTLISISGDIIANGDVSKEMWTKIKAYKNVSMKNPIQIKFVSPFDNTILESIEDLVCSPHGTEFTVLYQEIDKATYKLLYGKLQCTVYPNGTAWWWSIEDCDCDNCVFQMRRMHKSRERETREAAFVSFELE